MLEVSGRLMKIQHQCVKNVAHAPPLLDALQFLMSELKGSAPFKNRIRGCRWRDGGFRERSRSRCPSPNTGSSLSASSGDETAHYDNAARLWKLPRFSARSGR